MGITAADAFPERRDEVLERLRQGPGEAAQKLVMPDPSGPLPSRWTLRSLRVSIPWMRHYTLSGVWYWLERHRIRWRMAKVELWSPDPEYEAKREHLLACLRDCAQHPEEMVLLFLDEMGYYRWPVESRVWGAAAPEAPVLAKRAGENNLQWRIIGALNARSGQVTYLDNYIVGRKQVIAFYRKIAKTYPHAKRIYVVQDNWSIHRHPDVLLALQEFPQIEPVWLPTYAPWLNPIEKLWRWLRQDVLKMHRAGSDHKKLRRLVRDFLDQFAVGRAPLLTYVGLLGDGLLAQALVCS